MVGQPLEDAILTEFKEGKELVVKKFHVLNILFKGQLSDMNTLLCIVHRGMLDTSHYKIRISKVIWLG